MKTNVVFRFFLFTFLITNFLDISLAQQFSKTSAFYDKIVFSRQESSSDWDIWIMSINGSNQTRILNSTSNDGDPHFRYDGNKILFSRFTPGMPATRDIYTMDPDGNNVTCLTSDLQPECSRPKWSWDGTKIVFIVTAGNENGDIYIMNSDGSGKTALTSGSENDEWPSFSPDGQSIVFQRYVGSVSNQRSKICKYNISTHIITELTDGSNLDEMPYYSPDGLNIIFKRGTSNTEIYKLNLSTLALTNLTNNSNIDDAPAYSYDGTKITWIVSTSGMSSAEIWIMNSDGTNKTQLTSNSVADFNPTFSPFTPASVPEINIKGNNTNITSGDTSPSTSDYTDFGIALVDGGTVARTFTIENTGNASLTLSGSPLIQITGTNAFDFSVSTNPSSTIIAGSSTTFQITFDPSTSGSKTATISIVNNDSDENPYTFAIQGKGTQPAQPVYNKIAFTRQESSSDWDIWIMDRDGSNQQRLVDNSYRDTNPHFNPQGTKIVFARITSQTPMASDIWIMDSDGSNETNLTDVSTLTQACLSPHFSWDGTKITFDVTTSAGNSDIWMMNADGTGHTAVLATSGDDTSPAFSPDGQWIVFQRLITQTPEPKSKICKVKISDGTVVELTDGNYLDETPVYSTNGNSILFKRGYNQWDLYSMPSDHDPSNNSNIVNMTNQPTTPDGTANYSWEGDKIVYYTAVLAPETAEIYIMNTDGSNNTKITNNSVADWDPSFSPAQVTTAPEINIKGNNQSIATGDTTPSTDDYTNFGSVDISGGTVIRTFTIENSGNASLTLSGSPLVQITGTNVPDFSVTANPSSTIAAGSSTTFQIKFDPSTSGSKTATINIANNDSDENPYTFSIGGTGIVTAPTVPVLQSPANGASNISVSTTVTWNSSSNAASYQIQVSTDQNFSTIVVNQSGLTSTSYSVTGLTNNTAYYWKVNATNAGGTSGWSSVWTFTTIVASPSSPTLSSPANQSTNVPINTTLTWNALTSAVSYQLLVSTDQNFLSTIINQSGLTSTSYSVTGLTNNTTYYWKVSATNTGGTSDWSTVWNFTTIVASPSSPTLLSPANQSTNIPINTTLTWNALTNAVSYQLLVSTDQNFSSTVINQSGITSTSYNVTGLTNNTTYYWKVSAANAGGTSDWSSIWNFTTIVSLPSQVTLLIPSNNSFVNQYQSDVTFKWNIASPQVDKYWFEIAEDEQMTNPQIDQSLISAEKTLHLQIIFPVTYWWRVKAHNVAGWGEFSNKWKLSVIIVDVKEDPIPTETSLAQNYPNPFNPETVIEYHLAQSSPVILKIYNSYGEEIETLVNEFKAPGNYRVVWKPESLSSGVYFYRFVSNNYSFVKKMLFIK